jgi:hypothetical protein
MVERCPVLEQSVFYFPAQVQLPGVLNVLFQLYKEIGVR